MYDLSSKFNSFYTSYVVLPSSDQDELYKKKDLNIRRLKKGLLEYNKEHKTEYRIVESCVQGSVAMSTVTQNENKDYDIDVAVVFEKSVLGNMGAQASRNMVADALRRKTTQFNAVPEVKTSCVRIKYADGYHIDFAVYRRYYDNYTCEWVYEHAGSDWTKRELKGLKIWFKARNDVTQGKLRKVVRLSKMFCNSRDSWTNMPSGLIQTVLCSAKLQTQYSRIDELFYHTMKEIVNRLDNNTTVYAPVDNGRNLTPRKSDIQKIINWKNRLKNKLGDLDILFEEECSLTDAIQAWSDFFDHDYWRGLLQEETARLQIQHSLTHPYDDTEQFIEELYPVNEIYRCSVSCHVTGDGWRQKPLSEFLNVLRKYVPHNFTVRCVMVYTTCPEPYTILWKVRNVGPEAERRNMIRGQIQQRGRAIEEPTRFYGPHYIECYIIKDGVCVARKIIDVPIGWS